jgi:uncharacterized phage protein (TIGR02220 family)
MTTIDYAEELFADGNYKKAGAYLQYQVDIFKGSKRTFSDYARLWDVSKSTTHKWVKHFKIAVKKHHQFWSEHNEKHVDFDVLGANGSANGKTNAETPPQTDVANGSANGKTNGSANDAYLYINNIKYIVEYLNAKTAKNYKTNSNKTKQLITTRLKEKFTLEDFKIVVDIKCAQWLGTDMEKFLRPETLFGTKFEGYLNERSSNSNQWSMY